jgi:hypothetical protein
LAAGRERQTRPIPATLFTLSPLTCDLVTQLTGAHFFDVEIFDGDGNTLAGHGPRNSIQT